METKTESTVKASKTTFRIIEALRELDGAGITEMANHLDLSKSAVYKHCKTLENERYVIKEGDTYHIGLRFLNLGVKARRRRRIYEVAKPQVQELAQQSNEMANLMVEEHGRGIFLYRADSSQAVNLDTYAGREVYLHTTAMGKAILAHLSRDHVNQIIEQHGLPRTSDNTITDRETLFEELETIREQEYAFDDEERLKGLRCVATPIVDPDGIVLGAISISGPRSRLNGKKFRNELPEMISNAKNIIELNIVYE